ncbi:MAG: hypothetical protein JWN86_2510 [Planctomycetota bacterium]|nr:hypothetical protein [Planctomycetota bacterium]
MNRFAAQHAPMGLTAVLLALGFTTTTRLVASLRDDGANRADTERMERGYYERLLDSGRRLDAPVPVAPAAFDAGRLCDVVADLREYVLKPNLRTTHRGASWTTNSLGMRDREYATTKPANTIRIALVGDSIGSGWGVDDGLGFEPLLEQALGSSRTAKPVEILNFSVPGHAPGQRWEHFRRNGWSTGPDLVIFEATPADPGWDERRLRGLLARNLGWNSPLYREAIAASGATPGGDFDAYKAALKPHRWAILENVYRAAVGDCRDRGVIPAWVLIPRVGKPIEPEERRKLVALAQSAGFAVVIDLSDAFDGIEPSALAIAPDDFHPNARGHALLAKRLESALASRPQWRAIVEGTR